MQNTLMYTDMFCNNLTYSLRTIPDTQNCGKVCACENMLWQASFLKESCVGG